MFKRNVCKKRLVIKVSDKMKVERTKHGKAPDRKIIFLKNSGYPFNGIEKILNV